jgi:iron complex outermembrane receptor protein
MQFVPQRLASFLALSCGAYALFTAGYLSKAHAQSAEAIELPGIVVTQDSPVVRPKKRRRPVASTPSSEPVAQSQAAVAESAEITIQEPPPGTLVVADDAFVPVTVVTERELLANQGQTITDTLQRKPGIAGTSFAAGSNRPIIRGLDTYRVRVQENGIGTHDVAALSEDHAVPVDPFSADRVEVVRGPATLRYGSQAIGGVVAIENERIPTFMPQGGFSGEIRGGTSSVDDGVDGSFKATAGIDGVVVHADGFKRDSDDYDTPNGRQLNTFVESEGGSGGLSYVWNKGFFGVAFSRIKSLYGIPGDEAAEARPRIDLEQDKVLVKGEWRPGAFGVEAMRLWFGASDYKHDEVVLEEDGEDAVGSQFKNNEQEARVEIQHMPIGTLFGELRGAAGMQYGHRRTSGIALEDADSLLEPAKADSIAGFVFQELQATQLLRLQAALRVERTDVDGTARLSPLDPDDPLVAIGRSFTPVSASLGALYELPYGVVARLTGQYVERAPDAAELFSKGIHEATGTFEIGDPNLAEEKARTIEIGFKKASGALRFDSSLFYTRYDGFISKRLTGVGCGDFIEDCGLEDELDQVLFSQRDATFYGLEIGAQLDVAPIWRGVWGIDGQYDFVRAKFEGGENIPRVPPHRLGGGIFYRDANLFLRAGILHAFEQDEVAPEEAEDFGSTPGYTLVDIEASYTWALEQNSNLGKSFTLGLKGENLADEEVLNHTSFKRREDVLLPGASVRLFGSVKLN